MELIQISNHIYVSECDPTRDRPVLGYIVSKKGAVMVDAGNSKQHVEEFETLLRKHGLALPTYCVLTHWHWDHSFGLHAIHATTIAHSLTNKKLKQLAAWKWDDASMKKRLENGEEIEFADVHLRAEYPHTEDITVAMADLTFDKQLMINGEDVSCVCLHVDSAHSEDSVVVLIPEEKIIFVGDCYNDDFYREHYRDMEKTRKLYEQLAKLDFEWAVLGHSAPLLKERLLEWLEQVLNDKKG